MPKTEIHQLAEIFRARLLKMLKKEGLIDDGFIDMIMKWRHTSGFSVHNGVRIKRDDEKGMTALAQYIIRSPFSLAKLSYNVDSGMIVYHSRMSHGRNKKNFKVKTAAEFIADIVQHIPNRNFQLVRYYGWYSNRSRGERKKRFAEASDLSESEDLEVVDVSAYKPKKIPPPLWRECIKKIWEVDPLICPHCKSEMRIISFITIKDVIRRILGHLKLWKEPEQRGPPAVHSPCCRGARGKHSQGDPHYEPFDDGWPGYEEPEIAR